MNFCGAEGVSVARGELVGNDLVKDALDVLEVGHVARRADDGRVANGVQASDIFESRKRAVGCYEEQVCA